MSEGGTAQLGKSSVSQTKYYRFNPIVGTGDEFPIDVTAPEKLERLEGKCCSGMQLRICVVLSYFFSDSYI